MQKPDGSQQDLSVQAVVEKLAIKAWKKKIIKSASAIELMNHWIPECHDFNALSEGISVMIATKCFNIPRKNAACVTQGIGRRTTLSGGSQSVWDWFLILTLKQFPKGPIYLGHASYSPAYPAVTGQGPEHMFLGSYFHLGHAEPALFFLGSWVRALLHPSYNPLLSVIPPWLFSNHNYFPNFELITRQPSP